MNTYSHLLYKRGFLFTDLELQFKDKLSQSVVERWNNISFGKYNLYFEKSLSFSFLQEDGYKVAIIGLVLNPFDKKNDISGICKSLLLNKKKSENDFLDYLDQLSGRFIIITQTPEVTEVYNDACGTRTVFYDTTDQVTVIASHATMIADLLGYKPSKKANELIKDKKFKGRRYLAGLMSPYDDVKPLTPNTKYQVETRKVIRFFPREDLTNQKTYEELLDEISSILKTQAELLCENNKVSISMTAGLDSRLTYAAQRDIKANVDYFTHISSTNKDPYLEDIDIATKLTSLKNNKYTIYEYSAESHRRGFEDFRVIWLKNVGMMRGSMHLFKMYTDMFTEDRVHVRSNIAEIARVYYPNRSEYLSAKKLARYYTRSEVGKYPEVIKSFQEFIDTTQFTKDNMYNYEYQDLFYWEHRMGMWHSWIVNESDTAYETFVPYNNRALLKIMLSTPYDKRKTGDLFTDLIDIMWPELLKYPVNKEFL